MGLLQGLLGNMSEVSKEELQNEFGKYLLQGESIEIGFKLVRDAFVITNFRIIDIDKQGTSGKKTRVSSIYLNTICEVSCETAGGGLDDSEINITYITSPNRKVNNLSFGAKKYEFPKKFDIANLYVQLETIAKANVDNLNS